MTLASTYNTEIAKPKLNKIRSFIQPIIDRVINLSKELTRLESIITPLRFENIELKEYTEKLEKENLSMKRDINKLKRFFGRTLVNDVINNKVKKQSERNEIR